MCWHSHICSHLCRIPVPVPCGTGAPCMRHTCCLPMLHCRSRGKTIHILATSCTNICGLGVPIPTYYLPGPLWRGFGIPVCTLAKVPVQPTYTCCFSEPPRGGTGMPICAPTMLQYCRVLPGSACFQGCSVSVQHGCSHTCCVLDCPMSAQPLCLLCLCHFPITYMLQDGQACLYSKKSQHCNTAA